jgi:outer membrane lipoprotein SlyB
MKATFKHAMIAGAVALAMGTAGACLADDSTNSKTTQNQPAAASNTAGNSATANSTTPAKPLTGKEKATAIGAGTGALAGAAVGGPVGAVVGAGVGAVVGHQGTDANGRVTKTASNDSHMMSRSDDQVRRVQSALNEQGYNVQVDGVMGPQTESALKSWQAKNGLEQTGTLDSATLDKLANS